MSIGLLYRCFLTFLKMFTNLKHFKSRTQQYGTYNSKGSYNDYKNLFYGGVEFWSKFHTSFIHQIVIRKRSKGWHDLVCLRLYGKN